MSRTVDLSLSTSRLQYLVAVVFVGLLIVPVIGGVFSMTGLPAPASWLVAAGGWIVLAVVWVRRLGGEGDDSTWAAIPDWRTRGASQRRAG